MNNSKSFVYPYVFRRNSASSGSLHINIQNELQKNTSDYNSNTYYVVVLLQLNCIAIYYILLAGIATPYDLDGLGIEFRWWLDFPRPSRPALRPNVPHSKYLEWCCPLSTIPCDSVVCQYVPVLYK
jgi:hypothetical protein